jgi:hypothetical protein
VVCLPLGRVACGVDIVKTKPFALFRSRGKLTLVTVPIRTQSGRAAANGVLSTCVLEIRNLVLAPHLSAYGTN